MSFDNPVIFKKLIRSDNKEKFCKKTLLKILYFVSFKFYS